MLFGLLACCLLPVLPIYLWKKGRLSAAWGLGISGVMVAALIGMGAWGSTIAEPVPEPVAEPTTEPSPKAEPTISASEKREALIALAEKIAKDELPGQPYWEGATFKGTYRTSEKVCVDRTRENGENAGYVNVYFPSKKTGEPQDGTCAKPAPKPINYEAMLAAAIKEELGGSNRDVKRLSSVVYNDIGGTDAVVVRWAINDALTEGLTKKSAKLDITNMLKIIQRYQKAGMSLKDAYFSGTFSLVDKLGNKSEDKVVQADYNGSIVKQINFENFIYSDVYDIADRVTIRPAFK